MDLAPLLGLTVAMSLQPLCHKYVNRPLVRWVRRHTQGRWQRVLLFQLWKDSRRDREAAAREAEAERWRNWRPKS